MPYQTVPDINAADDVGYESFQKIRDAARAAVFSRSSLGGSRHFTLQGTGYQDAYDALPFILPDAASAGGAYRAEVWQRTADAGTSLTPKIRNVTDSTDAVIGTPSSSTSWVTQDLVFTPAVGKEYRLMFVKSNDAAPCWGFGVLQRSDS